MSEERERASLVRGLAPNSFLFLFLFEPWHFQQITIYKDLQGFDILMASSSNITYYEILIF